MTLRARLTLGLLVCFSILLLAFTLVLVIQNDYVNSQIDKRLDRLAQIAEIVVAETEADDAESRRVLDALWEGYIGVFDGDGELSTVVAPSSDRNLVPAVDVYSASVTPKTGPTRSGLADMVRSKTIPLKDGRIALVGLVTTDGDSAIARLKTTLALAGVLVAALMLILSWWSYRLGFGPIARMIKDADAFSRGDAGRRLRVAGRGTETAALATSLNNLIDTAVESEQKMRKFVADASHELRTPLTSLQGYASLYMAGVISTPEATRDAMTRIHAESARMARLVEDLLQLDQRDLTHKFNSESIDVVSLLEDLVADLRAVDHGREIVFTAQEGLRVHTDRERCVQVLLALCSNALVHAGDDALISIAAWSTPDGVIFEVSDSGRGIAPEHLPYVFDRLYKVDESRSGRTSGSGLGLSIVAEIMRASGGDFGVSSTVGVGSSFWVRFPS